MGRLIALPANIRQEQKKLAMTNILSYYGAKLMTVAKV
jgi:hypothetical protein